MKLYKVGGRMFVRVPAEDKNAPCAGCAGKGYVHICQALPNCPNPKERIYKEVVFKEEQDA